MKAVILARISDREQEEGHSVAAQLQQLVDYCRRKDLEVINTYQIIESSTRGDRREFHDMLEFIRAQKETIALVAAAVDRVQRSFKEYVLLDDLCRQQVVELHFFREGLVIGRNSTASDIMRWDFSIIAAKSYVLQLSENVKRSLDWKLRNGQCIGPAPLGYINQRDGRDQSLVIPDPLRAPIITRLFKEYAGGLHSMGSMAELANQLGLTSRAGKRMSKSSMHYLLTNRFYYGDMEIKGEIYQHNYEPLTTRQIFEACQDVLHERHRAPFKYGAKDFVFRGLLECAVSGRAVLSDKKKKQLAGGGTGEWTYLVAADPARPGNKIYVREETVLTQVKEALHTLHVPAPVLSELLGHLRSGYDAEQEFQEAQLRRIDADRKVVELKLNRLTDLLLEEAITPEEHKRKRLELTRRQAELGDELQLYQKADDSFRASLELLVTLASGLSQAFERGDMDEKREIMKWVFSNQKLRGNKLEYTMRLPFSEWPKNQSCPEWLPVLDVFRTRPDIRQAIMAMPRHHQLAMGMQ